VGGADLYQGVPPDDGDGSRKLLLLAWIPGCW
jgi:hypothetical protein